MNSMKIRSLGLLAALLTSFASTCSSLPPKAEKFDFQLISVSEYRFRAVRVFWNPHKNLVLMKIFENDRFLALESVHYATKLDVTISLNAHSFHLHSLADFLLKKNATAIVEVPAQSEILSIPAYVATVTDGGFEYRWLKPDDHPITNISLIWCDRRDSDLRTCGDRIRGYTELRTEATEMRLNHDESVDVALRIDSDGRSSGIVLPRCQSRQSEVGLLNDGPTVRGDSSRISIEWPMRCPEEGIVHRVVGYNLYYCRWQNGASCGEAEAKLFFKTQRVVLQAEINNLVPSTRYRIAGTVLLGTGTESGRREFVYETTRDVKTIDNYR